MDDLRELVESTEEYDPIIRIALDDLLMYMLQEEQEELAWRAFMQQRSTRQTRISLQDVFKVSETPTLSDKIEQDEI